MLCGKFKSWLFVFLLYLTTCFGPYIEKPTNLPPWEPSNGPKSSLEKQSTEMEPTFKLVKIKGTEGFNYGLIHYVEEEDLHYLVVRNLDWNAKVSKLFKIAQSGETVEEIFLKASTSEPAVIEKVGYGKSMIIFVDVIHSCIFVKNLKKDTFTRKEFEHPIKFVHMSTYSGHHAAVVDIAQNLFITIDGGQKWDKMTDEVVAFEWDTLDLDFHVLKEPNTDLSRYLLLKGINGERKFKEVSSNCLTLNSTSNIVFAICDSSSKKELLILSKQGIFIKAEFPQHLKPLHFIVHSATDTDIYVVVRNDTENHIMYSANIKTLKFVKLVDNIGYINLFSNKSCVDVETFTHLPGVLITQFNRQSSQYHPTTMISFNHGMTWQHVALPNFVNGLECKWPSCSLTLDLACTKYYGTSITTEAYAPHIMLASGYIRNENLYNKHALFVSTDAGKTWNEGLNQFHHSTILNHGGIIVLASYYHGVIMYSFDEGETWISYEHMADTFRTFYIDRRVKVTSTVPTAAFMIASDKDDLWNIIKFDFSATLTKKCSVIDYNLFTPGSESSHQCFNGMRSSFYIKRRFSKCLSILNSLKNNFKTECPCTMTDFGCNFGFYQKDGSCVPDLDSAPVRNEDHCGAGEIGTLANHKIKFPHDQCISDLDRLIEDTTKICEFDAHSDIISVRTHQKIFFMSKQAMKTFVEFPFKLTNDVISYAIDVIGKCLYIATPQSVMKKCWGTKAKVDRDAMIWWKTTSIFKIQFEDISKSVFLAKKYSIEMISANKHVQKVLVGETEILYFQLFSAVGYYIYTTKSSSMNKTTLLYFVPFVMIENALTCEFPEKVNDAYHIPHNNSFVILGEKNAFIFQIPSITSDMFQSEENLTWIHQYQHNLGNDFLAKFISKNIDYEFYTSKVTANGSIIKNLESIQEARLYSSTVNKLGMCHLSRCEYFCMETEKKIACLCPRDMNQQNNVNCFCKSEKPNCKQCKLTQFLCHSGECVDILDKCDGIIQCHDGSDEKGCKTPCSPLNEFACSDHLTCIDIKGRCDGQKDCPDNSDEFGCIERHPCQPDQFECNNKKCIPTNLQCDEHDDCGDNSDETTCKENSCKNGYFQCIDGTCIENTRYCNGRFDCADWSDEQQCGFIEDVENPSCALKCNGVCIPKAKTCDHLTDCTDGSDETNCKHVINCKNTDSKFCLSGMECYEPHQKCDGFKDCQDGTDEYNCHTKLNACQGINPFKCNSDVCVPMNSYCDGIKQCQNGNDEGDHCESSSTITELRVTKIGKTWASISWSGKHLKKSPKFSIIIYIWKISVPHVTYSTQNNTYFRIEHLSPCVQYHVIVSLQNKNEGRYEQFVTLSSSRMPPSKILFNKTTLILSWVSKNDEWCAPIDFFVNCYDSYQQFRNFTKESSIKLPKKFSSCHVSSCPTNVFNISCSPYVSLVITRYRGLITAVYIGLFFLLTLTICFCAKKISRKCRFRSPSTWFRSSNKRVSFKSLNLRQTEGYQPLLLEGDDGI